MKIYRADLHIHTVLSPCGDLDMSPAKIVDTAVNKGLNIIGITDHNTTLHCKLVKRIAEKKGIYVMQGVEITTKEEVHCLAFFENTDILNIFQVFLDDNLPDITNDPSIFGHQVQVDENEDIIYVEKRILTNAISKSIKEVEDHVHDLNGLFIPAHIDRMKNSVYSQLGFLPENLIPDALELSTASTAKHFADNHPEIEKFPLVRSSDAHYLSDIGRVSFGLNILKPSFCEIKMALKRIEDRELVRE